MTDQTTTTIAELNDRFRKGDRSLGQWYFSEFVSHLPPEIQFTLSRQVRLFDNFTKDNDPYSEHDFGAVELDGEKFFFKIDYYDKSLKYGSDDPSDPSVTRRVLTIMHSSEY